MKELKQAIENTLINNLESHYYKDMNGDLFSGIDFDSIQTCADYISKEIEDIALEFAESYEDHCNAISVGWEKQKNIKDLFKEFITDKYKEQ